VVDLEAFHAWLESVMVLSTLEAKKVIGKLVVELKEEIDLLVNVFKVIQISPGF